jgi:hypothetical protein
MRERRDDLKADPRGWSAQSIATESTGSAQFCHQFDVNSACARTQGMDGKSGRLGKTGRAKWLPWQLGGVFNLPAIEQMSGCFADQVRSDSPHGPIVGPPAFSPG